MNILLISDYDVKHIPGGAERSNRIIIDEGLKRNHKIKLFNFDSNPSDLNENYDIVISSNLEFLSKNNPYIIEYILSSKNHVRLEHDSCRYLTNDTRKTLFQSCKKTFFLTNYHYNKFIEYYGNYFINVEIVPDPIDTKMFYNMNLDRSESILYIGFMHQLKGTNNFIKYVIDNPQLNFVVASWGDVQYINWMKQQNNINFLGAIEYNYMPKLYNQHKYMYYNPIADEPFCRSVGEALLCDVQIINSPTNIGSIHMYNEDPKAFGERCNKAAKNFWEILECL